MKEYNYLQAIIMSFYSPKLYRDVANNWGGGTVLYLFILLVIGWSLMMIKFETAINLIATQFSNEFVLQFPEIIVKDGQIKTPENKPYFIKDIKNKQVIAVVDTSGQYTDLDKMPGAALLATKDSISYYDDKDNHHIQVQKYPSNINWDLKPEEVKSLVVQFADWLWVAILPIAIFFSFAYRLIQAVIYACIGKLFALIGGIPIAYTKVLKLSLVAITPAFILSIIFSFLELSFHFDNLLFFVVAMAYLVFALLANKS
ncbi:MAG: DUF1189 domain-containing protein [Gammaproteobacteria bacterium]